MSAFYSGHIYFLLFRTHLISLSHILKSKSNLLSFHLGNPQSAEYFDNWLIKPGPAGNVSGVHPNGGGITTNGGFNKTYGMISWADLQTLYHSRAPRLNINSLTVTRGQPPMD